MATPDYGTTAPKPKWVGRGSDVTDVQKKYDSCICFEQLWENLLAILDELQQYYAQYCIIKRRTLEQI